MHNDEQGSDNFCDTAMLTGYKTIDKY